MWTRRTFIATTSAGTLLAGCLGDDDSSGDNDSSGDDGDNGGYDTRLDELDDADPIDRTGEEAVEIDISPGAEQPFDPDPVLVDEMTRLDWTWPTTDGEIYPADTPDPCQWSGSDGGTSHSWEFAFEGLYEIGYTDPAVEEGIGTVFVVDPDE